MNRTDPRSAVSIVISGDVFGGFECIGPFENADAAQDYIEQVEAHSDARDDPGCAWGSLVAVALLLPQPVEEMGPEDGAELT
jgi:hypothetical protein